MAKRVKLPQPNGMSAAQSARFIEAARELGCDESPDAFEAAVKKVARHKPVAPSLDEPATTAESEKK